MYRGQPSQLIVNYDFGFRLLEATAGSMGREPKILWTYPFERLRMSSDDGVKLLWLDFGSEEGEMRLRMSSDDGVKLLWLDFGSEEGEMGEKSFLEELHAKIYR
ncbi:beta-1-syntrophin-like [Diaphorina citri]|uniref:Beta-1-syntrophin-like n=1 Tax=Diaphorina citri TaxID=121845 RepID=A0A1S3CVS9_DIACI|nr:beta-1-syntrophin-like [Diaphorina citri]